MGALTYKWRRLRVCRPAGTRGQAHDEYRLPCRAADRARTSAPAWRRTKGGRQASIRFGGVERCAQGTRGSVSLLQLEHLRATSVMGGVRSGARPLATAVPSSDRGWRETRPSSASFTLFSSAISLSNPRHRQHLETEGGSGSVAVVTRNIEDRRRGTTDVFSGITASTFAFAPLDRDGTATMVMGEAMTGGSFALLGVQPHLGRAILPEDDIGRGGHPVVMLGHGYWQRAFGADPQVVGRTLRMEGAPTPSSASPRPTITAELHSSRRRSTSRWRWRTS